MKDKIAEYQERKSSLRRKTITTINFSVLAFIFLVAGIFLWWDKGMNLYQILSYFGSLLFILSIPAAIIILILALISLLRKQNDN